MSYMSNLTHFGKNVEILLQCMLLDGNWYVLIKKISIRIIFSFQGNDNDGEEFYKIPEHQVIVEQPQKITSNESNRLSKSLGYCQKKSATKN